MRLLSCLLLCSIHGAGLPINDLLISCRSGDVDVLKSYIDAFTDENAHFSCMNLMSCLFEAVKSHQPEIAKTIITSNVLLTNLSETLKFCDDSDIEEFLDSPMVHLCSIELLEGLLFYSCAEGEPSFVKQLLKVPNLNPTCQENKALKLAVAGFCISVIDLLLNDPRVHPQDSVDNLYQSSSLLGALRLFADPRTKPTSAILKDCYLKGKLFPTIALLGHPDVDPHVLDEIAAGDTDETRWKFRGLIISLGGCLGEARSGLLTSKPKIWTIYNLVVKIRGANAHVSIWTLYLAAVMNGHAHLLDTIREMGFCSKFDDFGVALGMLFGHEEVTSNALRAFMNEENRFTTARQEIDSLISSANQLNSAMGLRVLRTYVVSVNDTLRQLSEKFEACSTSEKYDTAERLCAEIQKLYHDIPATNAMLLSHVSTGLARHYMLECMMLPNEIVNEICGYPECSFITEI